MSSWIFIFIAGFLEVAWALGLKASDGFRRPVLSVFTVIGMIGSFVVLAQGMRKLPVGTAYAAWTGIGAVGTAVLGMWLFGESRNPARLFSIVLIIVGIIGLKISEK